MKNLILLFFALFASVALGQSTGDLLVYKWNGTNWAQLQVSAAAGNSSVLQINSSGAYTFGSVSNAMLAGSIDLTSKVTGLLPEANGGLNNNATNFQIGSLLYQGSSNTITSTVSGTSGQVWVVNGSNLPAPGSVSLNSGSAGITGTLAIGNGGTGQTTAANAINALLPSQTSNSGKFLTTNGSVASWATVSAGVSSVSNSDSTLTISPTTGAVVASLNLAHADTWTANGAASAPAVTYNGTWFTGGSSTTTKPQILIETSGATSNNWNTSGTGLGINAASGFTGNLIDAQTNGANAFKVNSTGSITCGNGSSPLVVTGSFGTVTFTQFGDASLLPNRLWRVIDLCITDGGGNSLFLSRSGNTRFLMTNDDNNSWVDLQLRTVIPSGSTVASLPTPATGMIANVTDANSPVTGNTVAGGGSSNALVWYNGANWIVVSHN